MTTLLASVLGIFILLVAAIAAFLAFQRTSSLKGKAKEEKSEETDSHEKKPSKEEKEAKSHGHSGDHGSGGGIPSGLLTLLGWVIVLGIIALVVWFIFVKLTDPSVTSQDVHIRIRSVSVAHAVRPTSSVELNTICAAYTTSKQLCSIDSKTGTGWISFVSGMPQGAHLCDPYPNDMPGTPPDQRLFKEISYLLADGSNVTYNPGDQKPVNIIAIKKVPTAAMIYTYWASADSCSS